MDHVVQLDLGSQRGIRTSQNGVYVEVDVSNPTTAVQWTNPIRASPTEAPGYDLDELIDAQAPHSSTPVEAAHMEPEQILSEQTNQPAEPVVAASRPLEEEPQAGPERQQLTLQDLLSMGFLPEVAVTVLRSSDGDPNQALEAALLRSMDLPPAAAASGSNEYPTVLGGRTEQTITVLLELMLHGEPTVQGDTAEAISGMCVDERRKLVDAVIAVLVTGDAADKAKAANVFSILAKNSIDLHDQVMVSGAVDALLTAVSAEISCGPHVLAALQRIRGEQAVAVPRLARLVEVIVHGRTLHRNLAMDVLANIASRASANRTAIVEAGAIVPVVALLRHGEGAAKACAAGLMFQLLSGNDSGKESRMDAFVGAGGVDPLVSLLSYGTDDAQRFAAASLSCLAYVPCQDSYRRRDVIVEAGAVAPLVVLLHHGGHHAKLAAAGALTELAESGSCPLVQNALVTAGALPPLVLMLQRDDTNTANPSEEAQDFRGVASHLLWAISSGLDAGSSMRRDAVANAGAILHLVAMLIRSTRLQDKENAAAGLMQLVYECPTDHDQRVQHRKNAIVDAGGVVPLVAMLCTENLSLRQKRFPAATLAALTMKSGGSDARVHERRLQIACELPNFNPNDVAKKKILKRLDDESGAWLTQQGTCAPSIMSSCQCALS